MFNGMWQLTEKIEAGNGFYTFFRKTPSQVTIAGQWFDTSMSPGNPPPQYYAASPLAAQQMRLSTDGGIRHGNSISPSVKHLESFLLMSTSATGLPMTWHLCDYLLYYPFVDTGTTDPQVMTNTNTLPRYTDGLGCQVMVVSVASSTGLQPTFSMSYTNSDGVAERTSATVTLSTSTINGGIMTNDQTAAITQLPFMPLQSGDKGVRSIESVTFLSGTDVGLLAFVIVKPLITSTLIEQTAPCEVVCLSHQSSLPIIYDDAFLSLLVCPQGSLSGVTLLGEIQTIWN